MGWRRSGKVVEIEGPARIVEEMPGGWAGNADLVDYDLLARDWTSALSRLELQVPGSPASSFDLAWAPYNRAWALERLGREEESRELYREALEGADRAPEPLRPFLRAFGHAALGSGEAALRSFDEVASIARADAFDRRLDERRAFLLVRIGRHDEAIELLADLLADEYDYPITRAVLRSDPWLDPLRAEPRFQALVQAD